MSDDSWRRRRRDDDEEERFGPPLFPDEPTSEVKDISFGEHDTGPLPHWTEPPTGEVPRVLSSAAGGDDSDDIDVWSSFSTSQPVWRDDQTGGAATPDPSGALDEFAAGRHPAGEPTTSQPYYATDESRGAPAPRREPGRITIGTDPTGDESRPVARRRPGDTTGRVPRPAGRGRPVTSGRPGGARPAPPSGRDMPVAIGVGLAIAAVFLVALLTKPVFVLAIIVLVLALAAVEYFDKVTEKGYRPATVAGIVACVAMPLATYWVGDFALPLCLVLAFAAGCATFIAAPSLESSPMPNMAITTMGVVWIGFMGSFAVLILNLSANYKSFNSFVAAGFESKHIGTDTLCLLAIGVVANDVGALFVGSAVGRTPMRDWISPNKTIEGFIGGTVFTLLAMLVIGIAGKSDTWNTTGDLLLLGVVIAIAAPLGDLTESMFKRNLDIKDFGTIVRGHGGVLDRFDGFLFTLPAVYYLLVVLQPWVTK
jgi:phosphatidate cytidylyltransferase